jgi:hypothetical protein
MLAFPSRNLLTFALIAALPAGLLCGQEAAAPAAATTTPPALVDRLPPIWQVPSAARDSAK